MRKKTITIDLEAYKLLAAEKLDGESLTNVIRRHFPCIHSAEALLKDLHKLRLSDDTLDRVEDLVKARGARIVE